MLSLFGDIIVGVDIGATKVCTVISKIKKHTKDAFISAEDKRFYIEARRIKE